MKHLFKSMGLVLLVVSLTFFLVTGKNAAAADKIVWTFTAMAAGKWCDNPNEKVLSERIAKATNGRMQLNISIGLVPMPEALTAVRDGSVTGALTGTAYHSGEWPFGSIHALPGSTVAPGEFLASLDVIMPYFEKSLRKKYNVQILGLQQWPRIVLGNNKPIATVDDFKGQKIRGMGYYDSYGLVLLGAAGVSIPFTEAFMALQRGVVNGLVTGSVVYDSMGFWEYAKFLCNWPVHGYSAPKFYIANGKAFDALPADLKPIVLKVFREMADETSACNGKLVEASMKKVIAGGVKEINPSKEELEKAMKKLAPVKEKWIKDCEKSGSPEAKELLDKMEAFLKDYRAKKGK